MFVPPDTSYARNKDNGQWYYFDDSKVTYASEDQIVVSMSLMQLFRLETWSRSSFILQCSSTPSVTVLNVTPHFFKSNWSKPEGSSWWDTLDFLELLQLTVFSSPADQRCLRLVLPPTRQAQKTNSALPYHKPRLLHRACQWHHFLQRWWCRVGRHLLPHHGNGLNELL